MPSISDAEKIKIGARRIYCWKSKIKSSKNKKIQEQDYKSSVQTIDWNKLKNFVSTQ